MSKAEERARDLGYWKDPLNRVEYTANDVWDACIEGYHQAEKDVAEETIKKVCEYIASNMRCDGYTLQTKFKFIKDLKQAMKL